jgi:hypothetical protein
MKIRTGFVSNSSTSSFVAWGVSIDEIKLPESVCLKRFYDILSQYENDKLKNMVFYERWDKERHLKMLSLNSNEEKIQFIKDNVDTSTIYSIDNFRMGGSEYNLIGLTVGWLEKNHPELTLGNIRNFVAQQLNKSFDTNFTEDNVGYFEEAWNDN